MCTHRLNVHDGGYFEESVSMDYVNDVFEVASVPIVLVIKDARTCHLNDGTSGSVDRVDLVPDYLTCHCKQAAMDSNKLVAEVI